MTDSQKLSAKNKSEEVRQRAFRLILFLGIAGVLSGLIFSNLSEQGTEPLSLISSYGAGIVQLIGAYLIYKRRLFLGVIVAASTAPVVSLIVMAQTSGIGTAVVIAELLIYMMILPLIITEEEGLSRIQVGAVAAAAILILVDQYWPYPRNPIEPDLVRATYIFLFVLLAVFAVVLVRRFPTFTLRGKLVSTTLVVTAVAVTAVTLGASTLSRNALTAEGSKQMQALSQSQGLLIGELLAREITSLQTLSLDDDLLAAVVAQNESYSGSGDEALAVILEKDSQWSEAEGDNPIVSSVLQHPVVNKMYQFSAKFPENSDMLLTDRYGALVAATRSPEQYYFAEEAWWEVAYNVGFGKTYVSDPGLNERSGVGYLQIALPILSSQPNGPARLEGILYSRYSLQALEDLMVASQVGETQSIRLHLPGYELALDEENNLQIYSDNLTPEEVLAEAQADINYTFTDSESISNLLSVGTVNTLNHQPVVDDLNWSVSVRQAQAEALSSVEQQQRLTILLGVFVILTASSLAAFTGSRLTKPILRLTKVAEEVSAGNLDVRADITTQDEMGTLATVFNDMTARVHEFIHTLEQRVAARTRDLNLAAEIGRQVSLVRSMDELLPQAVQLVQEQFELYQAQIYLVDKTGEQLVLQASTGNAGTKLLEAGHTLLIDENSLNGTAVTTKQAVIVADTAESPAFRPHPLLPDTRSEMVVPLIVGENVVGVLDLQSDKPNALSDDNLPAFETLSGQLAIAIQNAALLNERRQAEAELQKRQLQLAQASELAKMASWELNLQTLTFTFNERFYNLLQTTGVDVGSYELEAEAYLKRFVYPEDASIIQAEIANAMQQTTPNYKGQVEYRIQLPDGSIQYAFVDYSITLDDHGKAATAYGSHLDITERKRTEQLLKEEQSRTQEILESINVPLVISRVSDGIVVYVNEPLAEIIRVPRDELIGQITPDFYHNPADREAYLKGLREKGQVSNYDLRLKRGDGDPLWTLVSGRVINFQGEPAIISSLIDITDRREAEATVARRATELETVANVSTVAATAMEPEELMQQVVDLTKERFNLYHAHLYMLNEAKTDLVLTSGAGEIGAKMVAEGRRIALTQEQSLVARAARTQAGVVINNVREEPGFLPHPLLPETRAEMAVPLVVGDELLGVLDVQSDEVDRFTSEDINIFTTLASQVAVALQNAHRHNEALKALDELTRLQRIMVREGWEDYLTTQERPFFGYAFNNKGVKPIADVEEKAVAVEETANGTVEASAETAIPIAVRGELIGKIALRMPNGTAIPERKQSLIKTVAHQVSEALERARLTEQTQHALTQAEKRSQEMAVINNIVTQISTSLDLQHSLQIVVDELATAVNVDQVRVALIQPEKNELLVIAEHYDASRTTSAVGMTIPIEGNELTQSVIDTRQTVIVEDAQNDPQTAPVHDLFREQGIETVILMPLVVNDEVIGTLGMDILDERIISADSLKLAETIVFQTATAIQNARLFEQIQATLAETEMLYSYSSKLNTATSLDAVLESAAEAGLKVGAAGAMLLVYDRNTTGNPEYAQIAATVPRDEKQVGQRLYLQERPERFLWPASGQNTVFIGDIAADERLSPDHKDVLRQQGIQAMAIMYLSVGNLRLGQILIHWNKVQTFTNADERLYGAIAQQASSVVYNRLLFNQTEEALSETAALYQASADINTANTFDEVLTALRQHTVLGQGSSIVAVNYFNRVWEKGDKPEFVDVLARWAAKPVEIPRRHDLAIFPEADILLQPNDLLVSSDIAADSRIGEETKQFFDQLFGAKSMIFVPLLVGNQWVGFVNGLYPHPMNFSEEQIRRLNVLVRQAAVSIQSIRLYEQTQEALSETAALYEASADLNAALTFNEVLTALREHTILGVGAHSVTLSFFDRPWEKGKMPDEIITLAQWSPASDQVQGPDRYKLEHYPDVDTILKPDEVIVFEDVTADERFSERGKQILVEQFKARSFVYVPIEVAGQWVGFISGLYANKVNFSEEHLRQLDVLARQAAVTIQSIRLYEQTQEALAQTEALYTGSERIVLASTEEDILQSLIQSTELRRLDRASLFMFDQPVEDRVARDVTVVATWVNEGVPPSVQVGTRFEVARVPFLSKVNPDGSLLINDIRSDSRVDGQTRQILESYGMISFVMIPIVVGSQWLGMVSGQSAEPMNMTEVQMRQANSLVGQAAVVMQTTLLFRQEQARARREHLLREIAAKVRNSTDIDTIMQTAVTEIGRTLGRRSFIKLGDGQNGKLRAGTGPLSTNQKKTEQHDEPG